MSSSINGRAIKTADIDRARDAQSSATGMAPDRAVITDRLIDSELMDEEAQRQGF